MIFEMYSIKDNKTGYMQPTLEMSEETAVRKFAHLLADSTALISFASEDFDLYRIGEFNSDSGIVTPITPEFVTNGIALKEK